MRVRPPRSGRTFWEDLAHFGDIDALAPGNAFHDALPHSADAAADARAIVLTLKVLGQCTFALSFSQEFEERFAHAPEARVRRRSSARPRTRVRLSSSLTPPPAEASALTDFFVAVGSSQSVSTWIAQGTAPCDWFGVTCNNASHVVGLSLGWANLRGTLTPSLAALTSLATLDLHGNNQLTGTLPVELGQLSLLEEVCVHRPPARSSVLRPVANCAPVCS